MDESDREEDIAHESQPESPKFCRRRRPQHGRKQVGRKFHDSAHHGKSKCIPRVHGLVDARSVPLHRSFFQSPAMQPLLLGGCGLQIFLSGISHDPKTAVHATCTRRAPRPSGREKPPGGARVVVPGTAHRIPTPVLTPLPHSHTYSRNSTDSVIFCQTSNRSRRSVTLPLGVGHSGEVGRSLAFAWLCRPCTPTHQAQGREMGLPCGEQFGAYAVFRKNYVQLCRCVLTRTSSTRSL